MTEKSKQMSCPHCNITKDGKYRCSKTGKPCSRIFCPYERDNYDDNYGVND